MAATLFQAPPASVHHHPLQTTPFGRRSSRPWRPAIHDLHLFFDFSPAHNSSKKYDPMHISTATDDIPTAADMPPTTAPLPSSTPPRRDGQPPRLPSLPTSLVPIEGRLVRHRPETHADQVSRLRGPTAAPSRAAGPGGEQRQPSTLRSMGSRTIDALFDELQAPANDDSSSTLAARLRRRRQRRRSPDPNFTPPMLRRTQPVRTWVTLTGDARAVAAAFGDAANGDDDDGAAAAAAAGRSPLRKRLRRTPVIPASTDGSSPSDDADPVPSTPSVSISSPGPRRRRGLRRCSSFVMSEEDDRDEDANGEADDAVATPFLQQIQNDGDEITTAAVASSWLLPPSSPHCRRRRRATPPKNPFDALVDLNHDVDSEKDSISFLSPQRRRCRRGSPSGAGDEPLRSPTEELSALSLGSDEDEMLPAPLPLPPPPPPFFATAAENTAPTVAAPKRRRGGLTRSMAGRFRMGEGGGLEAADHCST